MPSSWTCRRLVASLVTCALLVPSLALAQSPDPQTPARRPSRKAGIVLLISGAALAALGGMAYAAYNPGCKEGEFMSDGSGMGVYCHRIDYLSDSPSQRVWAGAAIGLGAAVAILGIMSMRRPAASPPTASASSSRLLEPGSGPLPPLPGRLAARLSEIGRRSSMPAASSEGTAVLAPVFERIRFGEE